MEERLLKVWFLCLLLLGLDYFVEVVIDIISDLDFIFLFYSDGEWVELEILVKIFEYFLENSF